jgi:hypothetical protein
VIGKNAAFARLNKAKAARMPIILLRVSESVAKVKPVAAVGAFWVCVTAQIAVARLSAVCHCNSGWMPRAINANRCRVLAPRKNNRDKARRSPRKGVARNFTAKKYTAEKSKIKSIRNILGC